MKKREDIKCLYCDKLFHPARPNSKFCCRKCAISYNTENGILKKSEEQRKILSEKHKGKVPWNKGKKTDIKAIEKFKESIKKVWTAEKRLEHSIKQKEIWSNLELLNKHSKIMSISSNRSEVKDKIAKSIHEYNKNVTNEQWHNRYIKAYETKCKNGTINNFTSSGEKELKEFIEELGFTTKKYIIGNGNNRFEIDIYIEEKRIGIEYNGIWYHATNGINHRSKNYHINKSIIAEENGISLIHIWEDQWINQKEIIKDIIRARLGKSKYEKIYARKCIIKEISNKEYKDFCIKNHIQGYRPASIKLGLFYKDELVQISSFNKPRSYGISTVDKYDYEWVRGSLLGSYECLTENGWRRLDSMNTYNGKVAQWNKDTRQIEWTKEWKPVKEYKEKLTTISCSRGLTIEGNPEHTIPVLNHGKVKDCWLSNLKKAHNDYIIGSIIPNKEQSNINPIELKKEIMNIIIQADGHISKNCIIFRFVKQHKIDRLKYYLNLFNIEYIESDWKKTKHKDGRKENKPIKNFYVKYYSNDNLKILNFDYTTMTKEKAEFLFNEMSYWDGTRTNKNYIQYFSKLKENADVAYNLVLLSGRKPCMFKHKNIWTVNMQSNDKKSLNYSLSNMKTKTEDYNDYLYCLSVPSHYFIVRNKNHVFITHNCISSNNIVIGGTSKLLQYFIKTHNPNNILCYSDWNLFSGKGYETAGFTLVGFTGPDKFYITNTAHLERINRNPYAYKQYKLLVNEGKLFECYGAGSKKFVWYKS